MIEMGCSVLIEAQRRYQALGDNAPNYEMFVRDYYVREAVLADAQVVDLAYDPPRVLNDLAGVDLYNLAVDYGDCLSKVWPAPLKERKSTYDPQKHEEGAKKRFAKYGCLPDNPKRFYDPVPCVKCGGHTRLLRSGTCCACDAENAKRYDARTKNHDLGI